MTQAPQGKAKRALNRIARKRVPNLFGCPEPLFALFAKRVGVSITAKRAVRQGPGRYARTP